MLIKRKGATTMQNEATPVPDLAAVGQALYALRTSVVVDLDTRCPWEQLTQYQREQWTKLASLLVRALEKPTPGLPVGMEKR